MISGFEKKRVKFVSILILNLLGGQWVVAQLILHNITTQD